jgi:CRP-like cAMP-binding protein
MMAKDPRSAALSAKLINVDWPLLSGLSPEDRTAVLRHTLRRRYRRRQVLFYEGDLSDGMHLIVSGWTAVRISTPLGDEATVAVVGPQEALGEQSLVSEASRRSATAVALTAVETMYLTRDSFDQLREANPTIDRFLAIVFEDRLRRVSERLVEALYVPTRQRIFRRVAEVAEKFDDGGAIPLTQEDLASLAGTTRPTVNRALRKAEESGALSLARGKVHVLDAEAVARLSR